MAGNNNKRIKFDWFGLLSSGFRDLSRCCVSLGDVQRAMQLAEESVAISCHCLPDNHPHIAFCESMVK